MPARVATMPSGWSAYWLVAQARSRDEQGGGSMVRWIPAREALQASRRWITGKPARSRCTYAVGTGCCHPARRARGASEWTNCRARQGGRVLGWGSGSEGFRWRSGSV